MTKISLLFIVGLLVIFSIALAECLKKWLLMTRKKYSDSSVCKNCGCPIRALDPEGFCAICGCVDHMVKIE